MRRSPLLILSLLLLAPSASAYTVAEHIGSADPTAEGWAATPFVNTASGPVVDDQGSGIDAWMVDDNGTAIGDVGWYFLDLTAQQVARAELHGWRLSVNLRVVDFPDPASGHPAIGFDASPFVSFNNGGFNRAFLLGAQADGDPVVWLPTAYAPSPAGQLIELEGAGPGYHLYEMVKDPIDGAGGPGKDTRVYVANQFGSERLDTIKEFELCIPSTRTLE